MKLKYIFLSGLAAASLTACNSYLEVDSPSSYTEEFVYSQKTEMNRALNGVYAKMIVDNLYGSYYQGIFSLNSDVETIIYSSNASSHNSYARFDCDEQGSELNKFWTAAYNAIEYANRFIYGVEGSELYDETDSELMQMLGEAKCLRAMVYHDLVVMFGDIPFTFTAAAQLGNDYVIPVADREDVQKALIEDLKGIAPYMSKSSSTTVERPSQEFAYALIARIALTAGGYSLHPDKNDASNYGTMSRPSDYQSYYQIAKEYAGKVIASGSHSLGDSFSQVFIQECNFVLADHGDVIFELPFAKESTGVTGYYQGPTSTANEGQTLGKNTWGASSGSGRLNAFYRYSFDENDERREFLNGLWYYGNATNNVTQDSCLIRSDYSVHNNKWSKLWSASGNFSNISTSATGINYPIMRYADVLLMYAEAINELEGPTADAQSALRQVHARSVKDATAVTNFMNEASADKESFLTAVLNERKWEFAGENSRWRDLVRNNLYGQEVLFSFLRYAEVGMANLGSSTGYLDEIEEHDGSEYLEDLPEAMYYHVLPQKSTWNVTSDQVYGYPYPNTTLDILYLYNPYKSASRPANSAAAVDGKTWNEASFYQWGNDTAPTNQCKYSYYGYVRYNEAENIVLIKNGVEVLLEASVFNNLSSLPPVRYILPYPNAAIQRSAGAYKNYYGYK